ncbi:hypothetical protein D9M72_518830 [compost metagenome]
MRPFVNGNKTDATDARAIWLAIQQPGSKFVGVKTPMQQATLTLHRQRETLIDAAKAVIVKQPAPATPGANRTGRARAISQASRRHTKPNSPARQPTAGTRTR